jgi:hypothetical protein
VGGTLAIRLGWWGSSVLLRWEGGSFLAGSGTLLGCEGTGVSSLCGAGLVGVLVWWLGWLRVMVRCLRTA